jgi:hypothetical protein
MSEKPKFYEYVNVYDFSCDLPGSKEKIQFKPVITGQIKKLLTYENETNYVVQEQALDDLISSSVLSEGFDVGEMYIFDRLYLLIEIRKKTKGEVLEFQVNCPECKSQSINRVNLDELELIELDTELDTVVELSNDIKVHLRHMKRKHQIQEIKSKNFPKTLTDRQMGYTFQVFFHACAINKIETPSGVDENININDRVYFIEHIPMYEMDKIKERVDQMSFGWKLEYLSKCVHCKYENKEIVPIQNNFFG